MSVINTNLQALAGARQLNHSQEMLSRSLTRLSSGSKIVNPSDDAAGLAVSGKLDAQGLRVKAATTNVQNAVSYVQAADGFLNGIGKVLSRLSELASFATDVTKNAADIDLYQQEFVALQNQLRDTIGGTTAEIGGTADVSAPLGSFNGLILFGANPAGLTVTIGSAPGQDMTIGETNLRAGDMLAIIQQDNTGAYGLAAADSDAFQKINDAIQHIATERAGLGAAQSRLDLAGKTLQVESENLSAATSRIRDVDVAQESTEMAKYNILVQSGTAMLAQANQEPKNVLQLLQQR
jgi:flagellin